MIREKTQYIRFFLGEQLVCKWIKLGHVSSHSDQYNRNPGHFRIFGFPTQDITVSYTRYILDYTKLTIEMSYVTRISKFFKKKMKLNDRPLRLAVKLWKDVYFQGQMTVHLGFKFHVKILLFWVTKLDCQKCFLKWCLYVAKNADDVMSHFADSFVDNDLGKLAVNRGQDIVFMISLDSVISIH